MALESGVSLRNHAVRARFPVTRAWSERFSGASRTWPEFASGATIALLTPMIIGKGRTIRLEPESLFRSALRRAALIAPWMHCRLEHDEAAMMDRAAGFGFDMSGIHPEHWERTSRRRPGREIPVEGYGGQVLVKGTLGAWATYLALAEYGALGGECALGFGAARVTIWP